MGKKANMERKKKDLGQFFTPLEVADFVVKLVSLYREKGRAVDPACGDGVFLEKLLEKNFGEVVGVDIDKEVLDSVSPHVREQAQLICANGLCFEQESAFHVVVSNPPFSAKCGRVRDSKVLSLFELGKRAKSQAVEILFLEKLVRLALEGGIIGVVLPVGILANRNLERVRRYLFEHTRVLGVVSLPRGIFRNMATTSKTCVLFLEKRKGGHKGRVFMSVVQRLEELEEVFELYVRGREKGELGFWVEAGVKQLMPEFYSPRYRGVEEELKKSAVPVHRLEELVDEMFCGRTEYGPGRVFSSSGIPFISAKVVTSFGIDFSRDGRCIARESKMFHPKAVVRKGDVVFVRVGVGCAGRAAVVTQEEEEGAVDDWCYVIRTKKELSPYFLAFYLQSRYGKAQLERVKRGVGTVTIPQSLLREIFVPLLKEQEVFEKEYLKMREFYKKGEVDQAKRVFSQALERIEREVKGKSF